MTQRPYALAALAAVTGAALGALLAIGHAGGADAGGSPRVAQRPAALHPAAPLPAAAQPPIQYAAPTEAPGAAPLDDNSEPIRDLSLGA